MATNRRQERVHNIPNWTNGIIKFMVLQNNLHLRAVFRKNVMAPWVSIAGHLITILNMVQV